MASSDLVLCMTHQEELPGWRFLGVDNKQGLWGKYFPDNPDYQPSYTPEPRQAAEPLQEWTREQWDLHNRTILERGFLSSTDRLDIESRLDKAGLPADLSDHLKAVSLSRGYLIPCPDPIGYLLRGQVRYRGDVEGGRYRWQMPDEGIDGHVNGELPLGCWDPITIQQRPIDLVLTEGTGIKPFIAAQILGVPAIGAAGGNHASSPILLREALNTAKTVGIAVDAGAIDNAHVLNQYRRTQVLLQTWGVSVLFGWWRQDSKDHPDIDDGVDPDAIHWLPPQEFWALTPNQPSAHRFSDLAAPSPRNAGPFGFLSTAIDRVLNRSDRRQNRIERQASTVPVSQPDLIFQHGDRLSAYQEAQRQGYKYILDSSVTGSGKSHSSGQMRPDDFGARQLIYCSDEHRNPTTPTLQEWPDLEARHPGLVREPQKDGTDRLRRANEGDALSVMPNCSRIPLIETLRDKGVSSIDTAGTVCSGCPVREKCATAVGDGYGYIHQRAILKRPYLRAHPDSLPLDYDLESVAVIWDEIGKSFTANTTTTITNEDFAVTIEFLSSRGYDAMAAQLRIIRDTVAAIKSERDIHGAGFDKFIEGFGDYDFGGLNPLHIDRALDPNLDFLNPTADHGVDIKDLPPMLRRQMAGSGLADAEAIPPQFYGDLLRVLTGQLPGGTCRIDKQGRLQLSVPRPQHRRIAKEAQLLIAQDATLSKLELALRLGVQPSAIFEVCEAHNPMDNLTIHQVTDLGFCGQYRGDDIQRRIDALVAQINQVGSPIIDFKKQKKDGAWFVDTRGVNIFQHEKQIILIGTPTANMAAVHAEWVALLGHYSSMDCPAFHQYLAAKTQAEMAQSFGRIRANRRPDEELSIWLISSFNLKPLQEILGFNLIEHTAEEITIEAASRSARSRYRILQFTQQLIESGKYPKIKIVAELANLTEGRVSQIAKKFFGGWKKLVRAVKLLLFGEDLTATLDPEQEQEVNTIADMLNASVHETAQESAQLLSDLLDGFGLLPEAIERLSDQSRAYLAARLLILTT